MYYALSDDKVPGLKDKLSVFVALGSATKLTHTTSVTFKRLIKLFSFVDILIRWRGVQEMFSNAWEIPFGMQACTWLPSLCDSVYIRTINFDPELNDADRFNVYSYGHFPNGAPIRSFLHYIQNVIDDRFQHYIPDYSWRGKHVSEEIPIQTISDVPVAIFAGFSDELADPVDALWTKNKIGDNVVHY